MQSRHTYPLFSFLFLLAFSSIVSCAAFAQMAAENAAIEDNSFLVEEAFNQEKNVIQHISMFSWTPEAGGWNYTYTEEWPFPGHERHQLSVTMSAISNADFANSGGGMGDTALNYRYQLLGGGGKRVSFSPRFTLLAPTGSARYGRGTGGTGIQTNLPLSVYISKRFITHWNAGATLVPSARNELGDRATASGFNLGQSTIWLARPRFNVLLETVWQGWQSVSGPGRTQGNHALLLNPGVRWAHNFANGLQIVPGISVPIGVGPSSGTGVSFYLSFEHPIGPTAVD